MRINKKQPNDFIDGKLHSKDFDIDAYNDQALKMFYDKVL